MNRSGARRSDESEWLHLAVQPDVIAGNDAAHEDIDTSHLWVLSIGISGLIVVDVLIFIYFWTI
jgi:hypothetical protein